MLSCNCLNIIIELEKNEKLTKESLKLTEEEMYDNFFTQEVWYVGRLLNINKSYSGLVHSRQVGLWTISRCINCDVQTHAIHREKGASYVLVHSKLLNQEAINNIKSSDLYSTIFHIVVNPNNVGPINTELDTYHNKEVDHIIKDINEVVNSFLRKENAAVEERIKKYSDEQYEMLNTLNDKAFKEREAIVRIIQNAAREESTNHNISPKSPKGFGNLSSAKHSTSNSPSSTPFSPKRPKSIDCGNPREEDDLMFDFEVEPFGNEDPFDRQTEDSDDDDVEEAEDVVNEAEGISIFQGKASSSAGSVAKSCPVAIPIFPQSVRSRNGRTEEAPDDQENFPPRPTEEVDIAASIKALARSVHGDAIFGELPRPRFSTQI